MRNNLFEGKNIVLQNDRVLLRPLQTDDVGYLMQFAINEPEIWRYSLVTASGADNLAHYISLAIDGREQKTEFPFIVFDKLANSYAGSTRFYDINFEYDTLQLGYTWYGKDFQGTGLNRNCKYLLLQFAFESLNMERVEFRADDKNLRSVAAMKAIGCKVDGILRSNMPSALGGRRDTIVLSILKDEWHSTVKSALGSQL